MNVKGSPFEAAQALQVADHADRLCERVGVVEDAFVVQADHLPAASRFGV